MKVSQEKILELYETLSLVRQVEEKIVEVYPSDVMQCPVHLSIGQESIAVALCAHLTKKDTAVGTHRGHALYIAKGGDITALFAELLGRVEGCCGGYGGSMHLIDLAHGLLGTSSIVGGSLPITAGAAMAMEPPHIACVLIGDGACDEGIFYETLNFAALKKLPVLFMCEHNRYSVYTHSMHRRCARPYKIARACDIDSLYVPIETANDTPALYALLKEPVDKVRRGGGPVFVECDTVRAYDHNGIRNDISAGFRPNEEAELFKRYCPVKLMAPYLDKEEAARVDRAVAQRVRESYNRALTSKPLAIEIDYEQLGNNACFA